MKILGSISLFATIAAVTGIGLLTSGDGPVENTETKTAPTTVAVVAPVSNSSEAADSSEPSDLLPSYPEFSPIVDHQVRLVQGCDGCGTGNCGCGGGGQVMGGGFGGYGAAGACNTGGQPVRYAMGVGQQTNLRGREANWHGQQLVPWEAFAYGEYLGPHRTPHVAEYRLRVNDQLEFVYMLTREKSHAPYQMYVGDVIQISSAIDASLNQTNIAVLSDGTVSLSLIGEVRAAGKTVAELQDELNDKYTKYVKNPAIVVQVLQSDTPLQDLRDAVDARAGQGGQARQATVSPDGTVQLPLIGSVPAVGLTLDEIRREVNARYRIRLRGVEVTPILLERAARFVFVVGEVGQPGRFELTGPTSVMQALALSEGFNAEGNIRQVIVFRRDQNWRLTATKLDLAGALYGRRPHPSDEIWLRDSDIVLVPKKPVTRLNEAVDQYFTRALFGLFPAQIGSFDAGQVLQ